MLDDSAIRDLVGRLARPDGAGGRVIERAAILAAGSDSAAILAWIEAHDGRPEALAPAATGGGLHGGRIRQSASASGAPQRYVLPAPAPA